MRPRARRPLLATMLVTALLAAAGAPAPAYAEPVRTDGRTTVGSPESVPAAVVPRLRWGACEPGLEAFQCTTAEVPLDYDRPFGRTTTIALTRLPASDPARRIGTLFTNPGGPGGSGVDFVQQAAGPGAPPEIRARFDILGFDPRGVARSDPATCFPTAAEEEAALADDLIFPVTPAEERQFRREQRFLGESCARTSPARFRHFSTANVARDMDLLRRAVGDRTLTYAGFSYGTFLGATYGRLFPERVRALYLDGTIDPPEYVGRGARFAGVPTGARIEQTRGGAEVFAEFLRQCRAAGPARCSLAAVGDPATVARQVLDRLEARPAVVPLPDGSTLEVTYQLAVATTFFTLYAPADWAGLADLYTGLALSDAGAAGVAAAGLAALTELRADRRRGEDYRSFGTVLSTCVDSVTPRPRDFAVVADAEDRRFPDFGRYRTWIDLSCHYLKEAGIADGDAYLGPWRQTTTVPVLVVGTRWDPATPYRNTRPYAARWPRSAVVTLEGWGHVATSQSTCVLALFESYLVDPGRRRADVTCPPEVVPFTAAAARGTATGWGAWVPPAVGGR